MDFTAVAILVYLASAVTAAQEVCNIVVLTDTQLREEIRNQLHNANLPNTTQLSALPDQDLTDTVEELKECVSNIKSVTDLLLSQLSHLLTPGYSPSHPATSCKEILQLASQSPSGLYWIRGTDNGPKHMYCDMERSCKGVAGGWMRLASIDMTDTSSNCPSGLRTLTTPRRLCARNIGDPEYSFTFSVKGVQYSRVCGKIIGYQTGSPDAFWQYNHNGQRSVDSRYVDGISLTHGRSPRKHIWTFAAAVHEHNSAHVDVCPCTNTRSSSPPAVPGFVGHDYFCDTGCENTWQPIFYGDDPLWDGAGCGQYNTYCSWNSPPWFLKNISPPATDDIEMRLFVDEPQSNEDISIESLELYVQ